MGNRDGGGRGGIYIYIYSSDYTPTGTSIHKCMYYAHRLEHRSLAQPALNTHQWPTAVQRHLPWSLPHSKALRGLCRGPQTFLNVEGGMVCRDALPHHHEVEEL